MEISEIAKKFANIENMYYGHGIGGRNDEIVKSIFKYGLRCSHNELYKTTIEFGTGSENLFGDIEPIMSNWEHKGSTQIIIASLPERFHHLDIIGTPMYQKRQAAFYNSISNEQAQEFGISPGLYLKPEFVMGMYDAKTKEFRANDRYYENLPEEEQKRILDEVKRQYIEIIKQSGWTIAEYSEILKDTEIPFPLTAEEILSLDNGEQQAEEQQPEMATLPNGIKIPRKQYEEEYLASKDQPEMVTLPNGVQIPKKQYEEEKGTIRPQKKMQMQSVKSDILQSKVTRQETQQAVQDMQKLKEVKRLQIMKRTGQTLSPEQQQLLAEHIRQTQQAQIQFQQRQTNKKSKGQGMEI